MAILGAVLAGGRSRRFGSDKALALLGGRPLIEHAVAAIAPHVVRVVICGRSFASLVCLEDRPRSGLGPLGAVNAALAYAAAERLDGVLTIGCDMPVFPAELADALIGATPAIAEGQPLLAFWPATLAPVLDTYLADATDRSLFGWASHAQVRSVAIPKELPNINTPADLHAIESGWPPLP